MRECRSSGSVEGVRGNLDSYSDSSCYAESMFNRSNKTIRLTSYAACAG